MKAEILDFDDVVHRLTLRWHEIVQFELGMPSSARADLPQRILGRKLDLKTGERFQLAFRWGDRETHQNIEIQAARSDCLERLRDSYSKLTLHGVQQTWTFRRIANGKFELNTAISNKTRAIEAHNRTKRYLIPEGVPCDFLAEIGVMNRSGKVLAPMFHKFRQINRFLEIVDDIVPLLPEDREIHVVDFGSGKSYLTFALHHLLTIIRNRSVRIVGVDRKSDVIADCQRVAQRLECEGLSFRHQDISEYKGDQVDLMVSLHACDTATDAALAQAVNWNVTAILAVPCCQHELASQMDLLPVLGPLGDYGILKDRFAALATDVIRAQVLELCGYQTQVLEFIDLEHTPKNLLIRAIKKSNYVPDASKIERYHQFVRLVTQSTPALEAALKARLEATTTIEEVE